MVTRANKKVQTRDALVNAATTLFTARGYDAVTVEDVAAGGGVSRRTLFRYFPTKDSLVFHRQDQDLAAFRAALARGEGMPTVRAALLCMADLYTKSPRYHLAQHRIVRRCPTLTAREVELDRCWEEAIAAALSDRSPRQARFHAGALIGLTRAVLREWLEGDCDDDLLELSETALTLIDRMEK
ncbi:MAG TPA: TetR family transcriptional regulator [Myxococcota bacterium]|nr:TetR family transcriptional regulator [Myxococcota bacterium]